MREERCCDNILYKDYKMSPTQKRMYLLQIQNGGIAYNMPMCATFSKGVDTRRLKEAFLTILKRHQILRTGYIVENEEYIQRVYNDVELDFEEIEWDFGQKNPNMEKYIYPFDLYAGKVIRIKVFNAKNSAFVFIDLHHIASDGISLQILASELSDLYNGNELAPVVGQYHDCSDRQLMTDMKEQEEYWVERFSGELPSSEIPTDYHRPLEQSFEGAFISQELDDNLTNRIKEYIQKNRVSDFVFFMSCAMILMSKYTLQEDVVIGAPFSGRTDIDSEGVMGAFVNTVALRAFPQNDMKVADFINEVKFVCIDAQDNQDYPFEDLVKHINVYKDLSRNAIFDVMFVLQEKNGTTLKFDGMCEPLKELDQHISKFDMVFTIERTISSYEIGIKYCSKLYMERTISDIIEKLTFVIEQVLANSDRILGDISTVTQNDWEVIKSIQPDTNDYPEVVPTIHEMLESQVNKNPADIALVMGKYSLTYKQLNERINSVAHYLKSKININKNDIIAIIAERSIEMIIAMYGIIKTGAAYLPIDPTYPQERIDYILSDSGAKAVLLHDVEYTGICEKYYVTEALLANISIANPEVVSAEDSNAYCIYTSGTTGKAKGVVVPNRGIYGLKKHFVEKIGLKKDDRVIQFANYVFDASVCEINATLLNGATLVLADNKTIYDANEFSRYFREKDITVAILPPNYYLHLENINPRILITAGSETSRAVLKKIGPNTKYYNAYGPTEATVHVCDWELTDEFDFERTIPIGKPISGTGFYIMQGQNVCGINVPGELCIVGNSVASGYINQIELNKIKFPPNPYGEGAMFRTGDIARMDSDGNIVFIGRADNQVKIRGFRVGLSEIEDACRELHGIIDAVAVVKEFENCKRIFAYLCTEEDKDTKQIRNLLTKKLSYYMVPDGIMMLKSFPVNQSGKIDKGKLPVIDLARQSEYVEPENDTEKVLCRLFAEIAGKESETVGINTDFFEIGGHSMLAVKLVNRVAEELGTQLSYHAVFTNRTPCMLAEIIAEKKGVVNIPIATERKYYPLSASQKTIYLTQMKNPESTAYNMPMFFESCNQIDIKRLRKAFEDIVARHEIIKAKFAIKNGNLVQWIDAENTIDFEVVDANDVELCWKKMDTFVRPFSLIDGKNARLSVVRTCEKNLLMFDIHHIVCDGLSIDILCRELPELYNGNSLEALPLQYKDFATWDDSLDKNEQKAYWMNMFEDGMPDAVLPYDFPRAVHNDSEGDIKAFNIEHKTSETIREISATNGITPYMFFAAALMITLSHYTGSEDVVIGTVTNDRVDKNLSRLIGMFVNTIVLRSAPEGSKTIEDFMGETRKLCIEAFNNQSYPYDELVNDVVPAMKNGRNPIFDVMYTMRIEEKAELSFDGISFTQLSYAKVKPKFDITFSIIDKNDSFVVEIEYKTELFHVDTINAIGNHFVDVVNQMCVEPSRKLSDISRISPEEKRFIQCINATQTDYPRNMTIGELLDKSVETFPDKVSLIFGEHELTYKELGSLSDGVATRLEAVDTKANDFVAVIGRKDITFIIGLCGVVKLGAAYVPIDIEMPIDSIMFTISDCKPKAVLLCSDTVSEELDTYINELKNVPIIHLSSSMTHVDSNYSPMKEDSLTGCVIYTSGTTGKPKGVVVPQRGIIRLVNNTNYLNYNADTIILQLAALSFDAITFEIWGALLNGGQLVFTEREDILDPEKIKKVINEKKINTIFITTALFNNLVEADSTVFSGVKYLLFGGEATDENTLKVFMANQENRNVYLINVYGPTEATTFSTYYHITEENRYIKTPIGKPISNSTCYVVDRYNNLCGVGMCGELYLGGDGIAKGYHDRAELTKEKFIYGMYGEGVLYKTGDNVRMRHDGNLIFMGRTDEQVKIRGYRIELTGIENLIRESGLVMQCVAKVVEYDNEKAIAVYYTSDSSIDALRLKNKLRKVMPSYMLPQFLVRIDEFKLTQNGKIDKKNLPGIYQQSGNDYVAPKSELEKKIASSFNEVLGIKQISLYDNFFDMGGHSLKALKLINCIEATTGVRVTYDMLYSEPTVEGIAQMVSAIENNRGIARIPKCDVADFYPMAPAQKRMYLIYESNPLSIRYNMPVMITFPQKVDGKRVEDIFGQLIRRHEVLRTRFVMHNGIACQQVLDCINPDFVYEKFEGEKLSDEYLKSFIKPFKLADANSIRMKLIELFDRSVVLLDTHHIVFDGMSMSVFADEFSRLYSGGLLEPVGRQYKDYSEWILKRDMELYKKYWMEIFEGDIPVLDMTYDYQCDAMNSEDGGVCSYVISELLTSEIKKAAVNWDVTEYMLLLSAVMIVLSRYSRQDDIVVGTPTAGRTHRDTENMLGMFVNTIALRAHPSAGKKYSEFLSEIKDICIKSYENQDYPFEELVDNLGLGCKKNQNPLFDVMFVLQNNEKPCFDFSGIIGEMCEISNNIAKFDLTFNFSYNENQNYVLSCEYKTSRFDKASIEKLIEHTVSILEEICVSYDQTIGGFKMITEEERTNILGLYNRTSMLYPKNKSIGQLFEEQLEERSSNIAIVFQERELSYRELDKKSNALAHKLRDAGVERNDFVGIMSDKSIEQIIAILAIIKSGGAYVPIDPNYPEARINYIMNDSKPKVILLNHEYSCNIESIKMRLDDSSIFVGDTDPIDNVNQPDDNAYVMYTSGTTGNPKGVMVMHHNVVRLVKNTNYATFDNNSIILQAGAIEFDASTFEIWGALLNGGRLVITDKESILSPAKFIKLIQKEKINLMFLTVALFNQIIEYDNAAFHTVSELIIGGEVVSEKHIDAFFSNSVNNNTKLINGYGPTEATTFSCYYPIESNHPYCRTPIGYALSNSTCYVLNGTELCGMLVPGELCLGGDGISKGYLNREDINVEKFIDNPFGEGKLYRTGDIVRWLPNGTIDYIGRMDDQVKIRGFRIEPSEISNSIKLIEGVDDAVVIVKNFENEKQLYAFYTSKTELNTTSIKEKLQAMLPSFMIPQQIIRIDELPITPNGKINRKALLQYETNDYIAPRNDTERRMCEIYEKLTKRTPIGITDDFFEIGGHSLKATYLVNEIRDAFNVDISLREALNTTTPETLAKLVRNKDIGTEMLIVRAQKKQYYEMSSVQKNMYILWKMNKKALTYNMPYVIKINGLVDSNKLSSAVSKIIKAFEILRTKFSLINDMFVQIIREDIEPDYRYIHNSELNDNQLVDSLIEPFDLENDRLLRVRLINRDTYNLLFVDMHHIICDGISVCNFMSYLASVYNGKLIEVPELQYKDYSEWINNRSIESQRAFWKHVFTNNYTNLEIPTDFARPPLQSFNGTTIDFYIEGRHYNAIKKLLKKYRVTDYMFLLSTIMVLLQKFSRQEDIVVGTPISGRVNAGTEKMLGMFVNTLAMRGYPRKNRSFLDFMLETASFCREAYQNQEVPFTEIVQDYCVERDTSRNPIFNVLVAVQNIDEVVCEFEGGRSQIVERIGTTSKFDLSFYIGETENQYKFTLEYCTDLFTEETIRNLFEKLMIILEQVCRTPDIIISDIRTTDEAEYYKVVEKFNDNDSLYPSDKTVHELFSEVALKYPTSTAAIFENNSITYKDLDIRSNQLANLLREQYGVLPNSFVAIISDPGIELIIGILAILKCGCAYVPIDKDYPQQRIDYIIKDSGVSVVLADYDLFVPDNIKLVHIDDVGIINAASKDAILVELSSIAPAYMIYTSGTTGGPKGTIVGHQGPVRLVRNSNYIPYDENVIMLNTCSISFDVSLLTIWGALLNGGMLVLVDKDTILSPQKLKKKILEHNVNTMWLTTTLFNQMFTIDNSMFDTLEYLIVGGERLVPAYVNAFIRRNNGVKFYNGYGPTENATLTTAFLVEKEYDDIPIGVPLSNTRCYILDDDVVCGVGVQGELCTTGDGVAIGYHNRSELTNKQFVNNPFGKGIMYRTGDIARWLPNGTIAYMGRTDEQVKIRGYRVELDEISSAILEISGIMDNAVILTEDGSGDAVIHAYLVSQERLDIDYVKSELQKRLPKYMVPSGMMQIDKLPVNNSGKLDKRALPRIKGNSVSEVTMPTNSIESKIAEIFAEVIGVEAVGIDEQFSELGGNSMKAVRMTEKFRDNNYDISLTDIFNYQTVRKLAVLVKRDLENVEKIDENLVGLVKVETISDVEGVLDDNAKIFADAILSKPVVRRYSFSPVQLVMMVSNTTVSGTTIPLNFIMDTARLRKSLVTLINANGMLRTTVGFRGAKLINVEHDVIDDIEIPFIDASHVTEERKNEIDDYLIGLTEREYAKISIRWVGKVLYRICVVKYGEDDWRLYLPINHLFFDMVSTEVLKRCLEAIYRNNGELGDLGVTPYYKYVEHTTGGFDQSKDQEFIEMFRMHELKEVVGKLKLFSKKNNVKARFLVRINTDLSMLGEEDIWNIAYYIFNRVVVFNTGLRKFIFTTVLMIRRYEEDSFYNTIGCFVDNITMIDSEQCDIDYKLISKLSTFMSDNNICNINLMFDSKIKKRFPKEATTYYSNTPVFNYLGVLNDKAFETVHIYDAANENTLTAEKMEYPYESFYKLNMVDVGFSQDGFLVQAFCKKGNSMDLLAFVQSEVDEYIKNLLEEKSKLQ